MTSRQSVGVAVLTGDDSSSGLSLLFQGVIVMAQKNTKTAVLESYAQIGFPHRRFDQRCVFRVRYLSVTGQEGWLSHTTLNNMPLS